MLINVCLTYFQLARIWIFNLFYNIHIIGEFSERILFGSVIFFNICTQFEIIWKILWLKTFCNNLNSIEKLLWRVDLRKEYKNLRTNFSSISIMFAILWSSCEAFYLYKNRRRDEISAIICNSLYIFAIKYSRGFQLIFLMEFPKLLLEIARNEISEIVQYSNYEEQVPLCFNKFLHRRLLVTCRVTMETRKLLRFVNRMFELSLLAMIFQCHNHLNADLYWVSFLVVNESSQNLNSFSMIVNLSPKVFFLIYLWQSVAYCYRINQDLIHLLHKINVNFDDGGVNKALVS